MPSDTSYVYHIRREADRGSFDKGYIGISADPARRLREHRCYGNAHLRNALKKYDDVSLEVIFSGTRDDCFTKEAELRPTDNLGWNIIPGGSAPPSGRGEDGPFFGKTHTVETRRKVAEGQKNILPWDRNPSKSVDSQLRWMNMPGLYQLWLDTGKPKPGNFSKIVRNTKRYSYLTITAHTVCSMIENRFQSDNMDYLLEEHSKVDWSSRIQGATYA